jgi:hypothetical protein
MNSTKFTATRNEQVPIFLPNYVFFSPGKNSVARQSRELSLRGGFFKVLLCVV